MKKTGFILFILIYSVTGIKITAQVFDYRYYESPAVTWNGVAMHDSRQLSLGGISLFASGPWMQIGNPSLFPREKGVEIGFSYNFNFYQSFQYWGINEGVKRYMEPFSEELFFPSSIIVRFGFTGLNITAGWYRSSMNDFPDFSFVNEYDYEQYDEFNGTFSGFNESYFISLGIPLSGRLNAGLKVEYRVGNRNTEIEDKTSYYYFLDGYYQLKEKRSTYAETDSAEIIIPELGIIYNIKPNLKAGFRIRYPLNGKAEREITRSLNNSDGLNVYDKYQFKDDYFDVPMISAGLTYMFDKLKILGSGGKLTTGVELEYRKWSDYRFIFYGDEEERDLTDTVKISIGAEYGLTINKIDLFLRSGFSLDRQPVKAAGTTLKNYSLGLGIKFKGVRADMGLMYFHGATSGITQDHFVVCTSISKVL